MSNEPLDMEAIRRSLNAGGGSVDDVEDLADEVDRLRAENERLKQNVYLLETTVDDLKRARRIIDAETKKANGREQ